MESYQQHTKCLITGSTDLRPLKDYKKHYLVKSRPIGFVFRSRIPTTEDLVRHYDSYPRYEYLSSITIKRYHELLDEFEKYRKTGKILDVGCGIGLFLVEARKRGWEVYGTEFTDHAIEICRKNNIRMKQGKLNPDWFPENSFDIVTSFEVIEHINNHVEEVNNINKILRTGRLFYFTTPNFNALERYSLKADYNVIGYPEHLAYYTKRTVNYLLSKSGFRKKKLMTTGFSLTHVRTSLNQDCEETYANANTSDERVRELLEKNRFTLVIKSVLNSVLNFFSIGSAMKGWYEKPVSK